MRLGRVAVRATPLVALLLTAAATAVPIIVRAVHREPRLAASNSRVITSKAAITIAPGTRRCQQGEFVPAAAGTARVFVGMAGAQGVPFELTLTSRADRVRQRYELAGYTASTVVIALRPRPADLQVAELCIRNRGRTVLSLADNLVSSNPEAPPSSNTPYQSKRGEVRVDYLEPGDRSVIEQLPRVAERFALFKAVDGLGRWALWGSLGALLALGIAGAMVVVRSTRS